MVKEYIRTTKDIQSKTKLQQDQMKHEEHIRKQQSTNFIIDHIYRELGELDEQLKKQPEDATDDELIKLRSDLPSLSRKFEKIAENYTSILKSPIFNAERTPAINDIGKKFEKLSSYKKKYVKMLHDEISSREVDKDRQFNKSNLNIKLDKFTGYDSKIDYYTFRSSFEKMHLQSTPKRLLPDLLKNNFLADPALTLVESLNDIDLIWQRLSDVYGNPKIMLSKRLQQLTKIDGIGKSNNPEKMINNLSRLVNMLNDVKKLAREHHIEEHLYYGDGLTKVYHLIGDSRTTKFLTSICDDDLQQREVWDKLISFLDKKRKVHQQKLLIQGQSLSHSTSDRPHNTQPTRPRRPDHHVHHTDGQYFQDHQRNPPADQLDCVICQAKDHTATSGPRGSKIVQYFAFQRFVEMSPAERFNELKTKGLCTQCLYPGALWQAQRRTMSKRFCLQTSFTCRLHHKETRTCLSATQEHPGEQRSTGALQSKMHLQDSTSV